MRRRRVIHPDLSLFIQSSIGSVWTLELLLFLRRNSGRTWTSDELIRELRASASIVAEGLSHLQAAGLVLPEPEDVFRYAPASAALDGLVARLDELYRERPSAVTQIIFGGHNEKLHRFADAFRLKKD